MNWMKNMSRAIEYIEENLTGEISYEEASKIACCSISYFQRMFSYMTGITISEYIRRRKMTLAGFDLKQTDDKIITISNKYGYTSPTAFHRAFTSVHGIPPSKAREKHAKLYSYSPITFSVQIVGGENLNYKIEEKPEMRLVGVKVPLPVDMDQAKKIVPDFWKKTKQDFIFEELMKMATNKNIYGITDTTNKNDLYYYIAVETKEEAPKGMSTLSISKSKRVIFENNGIFKESIQKTFQRFLLEWLPFSNYEYAGSTDIEVYSLDDKANQEGYSEIWITIKETK